ncbi:MAG TPA: Na+/H+ antiporter [Verrucomicrobiae bacterium]|jgi:CPA1 family monovalent cation:H+ antiporter|nr:Na+/H+ antiporter [Verrucomicrobiae bacterium]
MKPVEALVLLMCAIIGLALLGRRMRIPYPIALVLGGLVISLVPGLPQVRIEPDMVFLLFLPPLIYAAAWFTSWHDFRANFRPIFLLAVGLVLFTTVIVGVVMHALLPELPLALAFAFGAIVSPPDAVAATSIAQQMKLPKRIVTVLEGESLVNDATGLVALRFALVAAVSGQFSLGHAAAEFVWVAVGGMAVGLISGYLVVKVLRLIPDDSLLVAFTFVAPYAAYLPAERLHVSGVLAAVTAGMYGGWMAPEVFAAKARLNATAVWQMLVFLLNCFVFILIGLQLPHVIQDLGGHSAGELFADGAAASAIVILVRPIWVFPGTWLPRLLSRRVRARDPMPSWRHVAVVSWTGMRGVVSLAAALALPDSIAQRDLILFLTFCVIFSTLVLQGLSLPWLVCALGVEGRPNDEGERAARLKLARAALARLGELNAASDGGEESMRRVTEIYEKRIRLWNDPVADSLGWSSDRQTYVMTRRLLLEAASAERRELIRLRHEDSIDEEVMRRIEREIDLEESRLQS